MDGPLPCPSESRRDDFAQLRVQEVLRGFWCQIYLAPTASPIMTCEPHCVFADDMAEWLACIDKQGMNPTWVMFP